MISPHQAVFDEIVQIRKDSYNKHLPSFTYYGREVAVPVGDGDIRCLVYNEKPHIKQPVFFNLHGGGFVEGFVEIDDRWCAALLRDTDCLVVNVDYRLAPEHPFPTGLEDCYCAVRHFISTGNVDSDNMVIGGHSAGGNLAAAVCLLCGERREFGFRGLIMDYPPLDLRDPYSKPDFPQAIPPELAEKFDICYCQNGENENKLVSVILSPQEDLRLFPPTLCITAEYDSLRREAEMFAHRLVEAGVTVTLRQFLGCSHGFTHECSPASDEAWGMMRRAIINWIAE